MSNLKFSVLCTSNNYSKEVVTPSWVLHFSSTEEANAFIIGSNKNLASALEVGNVCETYTQKVYEKIRFEPVGDIWVAKALADEFDLTNLPCWEAEILPTACVQDERYDDEEYDDEEYDDEEYDDEEYDDDVYEEDDEEYDDDKLKGQCSPVKYLYNGILVENGDGITVLETIPGVTSIAVKWEPLVKNGEANFINGTPRSRYHGFFPLNKRAKKLIEEVGLSHLQWAYYLKLDDPNLLCKLWEIEDIVEISRKSRPMRRSLIPKLISTLIHWGISKTKLIQAVGIPQISTRHAGEDREVEIRVNLLNRMCETCEIFLDAGEKPDLKGFRWSNFYELASELKVQSLKYEPLKEFKYSEEELKLHKKPLGDFTLILPKTNHELAIWGETQHHCVGGYTRLIENKQSLIVGLFKGSEQWYTADWEFQHHSWGQVMSAYNHEAPEEIWDLLRSVDMSKL